MKITNCRMTRYVPVFLLAFVLSAPFSTESYGDIPFEYSIVDDTACGHRAVADVDGDCRNDIVAVNFCGSRQEVIWYRFPDWTKFTVVYVDIYSDFTNYRSDDMHAVDVDSDGYIGELIPLWIESGLNVCDPIEVAAHNDINEFRRRFGHKMAYRGGVDKRAIAKGGDVIRTELKRLAPVVKDGGYIPKCDHGVPSDISWPNFVDYSRLLAQMTGWL